MPAASTNPIFISERKTWTLELDNADSTTLLAFVAAGVQGTLIEAISATTDDTTAVELELAINDGTSDFQIGSVTIPVGSGTDGGTTPAVDVLNQSELPWLRDALTLALEEGHTLKAGAYAAITATKVVNLVAIGGDY